MAAGKPGPARKPRLVQVREGNVGHRKIPWFHQPPPMAPEEPAWIALEPNGADPERSRRIRRRARDLWRRWVAILRPQGLVTLMDEPLLRDAALTFARLEETERQIASDDWLQDGQRGKVPHRLFTRASQLRAQAYRYLPQLGLSPAARLESQSPTDDGDDLFD